MRMSKKLSLEYVWVECLKMWKWVAENFDDDGWACVWYLKERYLQKHRIKIDLHSNCFFCQYNLEQEGTPSYDGENPCSNCPAKLISKNFSCESETYDYEDKPKQFYKKILGLYEKFQKEEISRREECHNTKI